MSKDVSGRGEGRLPRQQLMVNQRRGEVDSLQVLMVWIACRVRVGCQNLQEHNQQVKKYDFRGIDEDNVTHKDTSCVPLNAPLLLRVTAYRLQKLTRTKSAHWETAVPGDPSLWQAILLRGLVVNVNISPIS